jgi:PKD repeat protein
MKLKYNFLVLISLLIISFAIMPYAMAIEFTSNETIGITPLSIQFTMLENESFVPVNYFWDFGDDYTTTEQNPIHTYETSGNYTVYFAGINELSEEENVTKTDYIEVYALSPEPLGCGNISLTLDEKGTDFIKWSWETDSTTSGASLDGVYLPVFDVMSNSYIATELSPNSTHIFKIYNTTDSGCNTTKTFEAPKSEQDKFLGFINIYILVIVCLVFAVAGIAIPICGIGCCIFAIMGLLSSANNTFTMGLLFFIFLIVGAVEALTSL